MKIKINVFVIVMFAAITVARFTNFSFLQKPIPPAPGTCGGHCIDGACNLSGGSCPTCTGNVCMAPDDPEGD